jgi:D-alanine-D-alanine ligase
MTDSPLHVLVLSGGISHEREISLKSGRRVAEGLRTHGLTVTTADPDHTLLAQVSQPDVDVVWPVLHGVSGEDGALRSLLEMMGVPYVGSSAEATRLAWDKPAAKTIVSRAGVTTPPFISLSRDAFRELGAESVLEAVGDSLGFPVVTKPARGGSAQGVSWVSHHDELRRAMIHAFTYCDEVVIERQIIGVEVAVPIVDTGNGPIALPGVEIEPLSGHYTFEARYNPGETRFFCPPQDYGRFEDTLVNQARLAHDTLGLSDISRMDFIVDADGACWFLEASVMPGLTETSTVALAINQAGYDLGSICASLAEAAYKRSEPVA